MSYANINKVSKNGCYAMLSASVKITDMEYINYLMEMNNWTVTGLVAGFGLGFIIGMYVREFIYKLKRRQ